MPGPVWQRGNAPAGQVPLTGPGLPPDTALGSRRELCSAAASCRGGCSPPVWGERKAFLQKLLPCFQSDVGAGEWSCSYSRIKVLTVAEESKGKSFSAAPGTPSHNFGHTSSPEIKPAHLEKSLSKSALRSVGEAGCPGAAAGLPAPTLAAARRGAAGARRGAGPRRCGGCLGSPGTLQQPFHPCRPPTSLGAELNRAGERKDLFERPKHPLGKSLTL